MIRFLLGRTGSGKTATVMQSIRAHLQMKQDVILFVPEQQLFSMERAFLPMLSADESAYLTITSFTKLCDTIEELYGGRTHTSLSKATEMMLMWFNLKSLNGLLETYHSIPSGDTNFVDMMLALYRELSGNGITSEQLESVADSLPSDVPLASKLKDIALITSSYSALAEEICGHNPADRLIRATNTARKQDYFRGKYLFFDSFSSYTYQEYAMMTEAMTEAEEMTVTLGFDDPFCEEPQFDSLKETYRRLNGIASSQGIQRCVEKLQRSDDQTELGVLESSLWNFQKSPAEISSENQGHVRMVTAPNPYEEAQAAALHILELHAEGHSFDEIVVVVRDMNQWRGVLDAALEQYRIPYYISEKTDLNKKPAARLLILALRCIGRHYRIQDVMSLSKTGLCDISPRALDSFEEYTETWHLSGNRLLEPSWNMNPDGYKIEWSSRGKRILDDANSVREKLISPLQSLEVKLKAAEDLTDQCKALYEYLCELSVKEQLAVQGETHLSLGHIREAGETVRLWSFINEALATLATVSTMISTEEPTLTPDELASLLSMLYAATDIGSVPSQHDSVIIGTADNLRVDNVKSALLLGLNEGEFPANVRSQGILTDQDKDTLCQCGIEFSSRKEMLTSEELLYVYRAMTKPREQLILSRSLLQTDGRELTPSAAYTRVAYLLPHIKPIPFSAAYLDENTSDVFSPATDDTLPPPRAYALLGEEMWLSRSKLQRYSGCPYSYYGSYVLQLREKISASVDNQVSGLFLHHVLEHYLRHAIDERGNLLPISDDDMIYTANQIINDYIQTLNASPTICREGRFLHTFDRLRAIALVLLKNITEELRQGSFSPVGFEWDTHGHSPDDPQPLVLSLFDEADENLPVGIQQGASVKLKMGGIIDRVDTYRSSDGQTVYIRVVDYKSSKHDFSDKSITADMDIQLLLYLFTLCSEKNKWLFADAKGNLPERVLPAQAMYLSPKEDTDIGEISCVRTGILLNHAEVLRAVSCEGLISFMPEGTKIGKDGNFSGKALYSSERIQALEDILHQTILENARQMYSGNAQRTPSSDACKYCRQRVGCPVASESNSF